MSINVILHISGEEPILGELDELPNSGDTILFVNNPRRRDGKDISYIAADVITVFWPMNKLNFVEILPTESEEEIIGFVRE